MIGFWGSGEEVVFGVFGPGVLACQDVRRLPTTAAPTDRNRVPEA